MSPASNLDDCRRRRWPSPIVFPASRSLYSAGSPVYQANLCGDAFATARAIRLPPSVSVICRAITTASGSSIMGKSSSSALAVATALPYHRSGVSGSSQIGVGLCELRATQTISELESSTDAGENVHRHRPISSRRTRQATRSSSGRSGFSSIAAPNPSIASDLYHTPGNSR